MTFPVQPSAAKCSQVQPSAAQCSPVQPGAAQCRHTHRFAQSVCSSAPPPVCLHPCFQPCFQPCSHPVRHRLPDLDIQSETPLHAAAARGPPPSAEEDPHYGEGSDDPLPGGLETAQMLIAAGADASAVYYNDMSVLHVAARTGHIELAELLIKEGAFIVSLHHESPQSSPITSNHLESPPIFTPPPVPTYSVTTPLHHRYTTCGCMRRQ